MTTRAYIQNISTLCYYHEADQWVEPMQEATAFPSSAEAVLFAVHRHVTHFQVVAWFADVLEPVKIPISIPNRPELDEGKPRHLRALRQCCLIRRNRLCPAFDSTGG
jgi:hypothetical protein